MNHGYAVWAKQVGYPCGAPVGNPKVYDTEAAAKRLVSQWNSEAPAESEPFEVKEVWNHDGKWLPRPIVDEKVGA